MSAKIKKKPYSYTSIDFPNKEVKFTIGHQTFTIKLHYDDNPLTPAELCWYKRQFDTALSNFEKEIVSRLSSERAEPKNSRPRGTAKLLRKRA